MRRNKKLEEDIEGTIQEFCGREKAMPIPTWKLSTKLKVIAVIICLLVLGGLFLLNDAYKKGYAHCKLELLRENLIDRTYLKLNPININPYTGLPMKYSLKG